jgi:hypothetical protein
LLSQLPRRQKRSVEICFCVFTNGHRLWNSCYLRARAPCNERQSSRGEAPGLFGIEPPRPRIEAVRIVDMSGSNSWAEFAGVFCQTRAAYLEHDAAKSELKKLMPEDAKEAIGHGIRAKRSKSGAVSFDLMQMEADHAAL